MSETARKDIHNSEIPLVCLSCEARHKGVCGALSPEQLLKLGKHTNRQRFESDEEMLAAGTDIHTFSNVLKGVVKLTKLMSDGRQQIVGLQFAPDFVGRPFRRESDTAFVAATDVVVCSFPRNVLENLIKQSPDLEHRLHEQALQELDEARDWMLTLGRKTASEKVASFLYLIASHVDPEADTHNGRIGFELPLKRADIADFLGLTIETVSRQITKLRKAGLIEVEHNRTVVVPDLARLRGAREVDRD